MKIAFAFLGLLVLSTFVFGQPCLNSAKEVPPVLSPETRALYERNLEEAETVHLNKPNEADSIIWLGRRTAYLGRYKDAIRIFASGSVLFKNDARFLRHMGHRYITIRCFDEAILVLDRAAKLVQGKPDEIEPDGLPNAKNIPTSTLQSNIWYHLGLAHYLKGEFEKALKAYEEAEKVSSNSDMRVATAYWHYMTLRRLGRKGQAKKILKPFAGKIDVIENDEYLKLIRLNRGELKPQLLESAITKTGLNSATLGYGLGVYYLNAGSREKAWETFRRVLESDQWASFGFIASEQDIKNVQVVAP